MYILAECQQKQQHFILGTSLGYERVSTAVSATGALTLTPSAPMETTSTPVSSGKFHTFGNYWSESSWPSLHFTANLLNIKHTTHEDSQDFGTGFKAYRVWRHVHWTVWIYHILLTFVSVKNSGLVDIFWTVAKLFSQGRPRCPLLLLQEQE